MSNKKKTSEFTAQEKAAMKERAKELKAEARANKKREDGVNDIFEKIAEMPKEEGAMAKRLHKIITEAVPDLMPKTWYGMPAYANQDGKVICFFQAASKYDTRYATFGFQHDADLDDGDMWATSFALKKITSATEKKIIELVKKAVS